MLSRSQETLFSRQLLPFWLGLGWVMVVPFLSIYRVGPLSSYYLEVGSLFGVLIFVFYSAFSGCLNVKMPHATAYFFVLAVFWAVQARVMNLVYPGLSDMAAWSFVILALGCWAIRGWVMKIGLERTLSVLAAVLLIGCTLQGVVAWLQYTGLASYFSGYLMYRAGIVEGQVAQRNHLGHYMMWGMLAAGWLFGQRRLTAPLALMVMAFFASVMGLTGSRTVFGFVLAIMLLLPLAGVFSGSLKTRTALGLFIAALMVLLFQFALEPILSWFHSDVQSAAERLSGSQFGGSGRGYEWQKAWQVFLSAPLFGHGWGSYSLYGFLTNVYPTGFRPYEGNVLFTHSHNSFLNLLAEMGLVGTLLVLGGLASVLWNCFKRGFGAAGLFILALVSVSLVHSFLEYPLWYVYFLSAFGLFLGFVPPTAAESNVSSSLNRVWVNIGVMAACLVLMAGIVRLSFAYQDLRAVSGKVETVLDKRAKAIVGLLTIAKTEPMLRYYAQLELMNYFDPNDSMVPEWAEDAAREAMRYRPYANAYKWGLIAERMGKTQEARNWMQLMYRYYPTKFSAYGSAIMQSDKYANLQADYTQTCTLYFQKINKLPECTPAPMVKLKLFGASQ